MGDIADTLSGITVSQAADELATLRTQKGELEQKIALMEQFIEARRRARGAASIRGGEEPASIPDAILALATVWDEGEEVRAGAITRAIRERGWLEGRTPSSVSAALARLVSDGKIRRIRKGVYGPVHAPESPPTAEPDKQGSELEGWEGPPTALPKGWSGSERLDDQDDGDIPF